MATVRNALANEWFLFRCTLQSIRSHNLAAITGLLLLMTGAVTDPRGPCGSSGQRDRSAVRGPFEYKRVFRSRAFRLLQHPCVFQGQSAWAWKT
jgi:hypothetical protein